MWGWSPIQTQCQNKTEPPTKIFPEKAPIPEDDSLHEGTHTDLLATQSGLLTKASLRENL